MAINKETGQQVACKVVDIRGLRRKLQQLEAQKSKSFHNSRKPAAEVNDHAQVEEVNKWTRRNYQTKYIEKKLKVYDREAEILEKLRHVRPVFRYGLLDYAKAVAAKHNQLRAGHKDTEHNVSLGSQNTRIWTK